LIEAGIHDLPILDIDPATVGPYIRNTLRSTRTRTANKRCSTSTASCVPANRRHGHGGSAVQRLFSMASVTIFPRSAA
jgi:hypothetical protein